MAFGMRDIVRLCDLWRLTTQVLNLPLVRQNDRYFELRRNRT